MLLKIFLTLKTCIIVLGSVYQIPNVNFKGMFWPIPNGRYLIVNEHALNNSQDIVLTLGIVASMANITVKGFVMKEEPNLVSHNSKFSISIAKSLLINLCDSFDEDNPSLPDVVVLVSVNTQLAKE
jgi:hypothetical protein